MDHLSASEIFESLDAIIAALEADEHRFYIVLDIAHQLRDELSETLQRDEDE